MKKQTSVSELLRELRESRGQSLRETASDLGVDPSYLSRVERGSKAASDKLVQRAASYYNVDSELVKLAAGDIPPDVLGILQNHPELLDELRERYGSDTKS